MKRQPCKKIHVLILEDRATDADLKDPEMVDEILAKGARDYVLKDHLNLLAPTVHSALGFGRGM